MALNLIQQDRKWGSVQRRRSFGRAASLLKSSPICLHRLVFLQGLESLAQYLRSPAPRGLNNFVVHPLSVAPRRDHFGSTEVCQMP
jgi:hypothetical protein